MRISRSTSGVVGVAAAVFTAVALVGPAAAATFELAPAPDPYKSDYQCDGNYFPDTGKWEISWGQQNSETGAPLYSSTDHDGLTYIDPQYADKTPSQELERIKEYNSEPGHDKPNTAYHWWYPSRAMVTDGAKLVLGFEDGTVISGDVTVGSDHCPAVRWIEYNEDGAVVNEVVPDSYPKAPFPPKPTIPTDSDDEAPSPFGSLGSLGSLFGM